MFTLNSDITVGNLRFAGVHAVRVKKSLHTFVEEASIKLPATAAIRKAQNDNDPQPVATATLFQIGDPVVIKLGYNGELVEEFRGFVKRRNLTVPFELECEGYSWKLLKTDKFSKSWKEVSLRSLLEFITAGTGIRIHPDVPDATLKGVVIDRLNGYEALEMLKKQGHVLYSFFIGGDQLYAGLKDESQKDKLVQYRLGWNTIKDDQLKYRRKEDVKVFVSVTYKDDKGKTKHSTTGERGGLELEYRYGRLTATQAVERATQAASMKVYEGYEGRINCFLQPFCQPGWTSRIQDKKYPERNGDFIVESIEVNYGTGGARRVVEIGTRISSQK